MKGKLIAKEDDYSNISFNREGMKFTDAIARHKSQTNREFFESKLLKSPNKTKINEFIGTTLSKLNTKLKDDIVVGVHDVSSQQIDLKGLNKKIQIDLASKEIENSLQVIRAKDWSVVTNEDYKRK